MLFTRIIHLIANICLYGTILALLMWQMLVLAFGPLLKEVVLKALMLDKFILVIGASLHLPILNHLHLFLLSFFLYFFDHSAVTIFFYCFFYFLERFDYFAMAIL